MFQFAREKACELEDYQCISLSGTDLEGDEEPAVKKRKLVKQVLLHVVVIATTVEQVLFALN